MHAAVYVVVETTAEPLKRRACRRILGTGKETKRERRNANQVLENKVEL